jgi:acyl carrier protein
MTKEYFFEKLSDSLEMSPKDLNEDSKIQLDSMQSLSLIAFADEYFQKELKISELKNIKSIGDIIGLIGIESFE